MGIGFCKTSDPLMKYLFRIFVFICTSTAFAKVHLNEGVVKEYLKIQKEFSNTMCTPGLSDNYKKLSKDYLGDGRYIPTTLDDELDSGSIRNFVSSMNEKSSWLQTQIDFVQSLDNFSLIHKTLDLLESELDFYYNDRSIVHVGKIKLLLDELKLRAPFLLSFKFPLDHLKMREDYDRYKSGTTTEARRRANSIYFYRKIVQDGTFDSEMLKTDSVVRAAFDTLYLSIVKKQETKKDLSDIDRVDLVFLIRNYSHLLNEGKNKQLLRLQEWLIRNNRARVFYQELLSRNNVSKATVLADKSNMLFNLKNFVLTNEAKTYEFWMSKSELMQALFVLETILYNEVGQSDAPDGLDRRDVAQVVINRFGNNQYNMLKSEDSIIPYLSEHKKDLSKNKWLNILFKEGEFSFTYFYIPGNLQIYCPDMSRSGQFFRRENTRIALELLNHPRKSFKALRYFSRISMMGRISMDSLWNDFVPLPEVPGNLVRNYKKINNAIKAGDGRLLYQFTNDELKKTFQVVEIKNKKYVVDVVNTKNIYYYRSPHVFRYFAPIK
jgi:hypothetical protein